MNTESELEIKIPLLIFKRIFYFAAIIKIIFCTWLNIEAHLWCNIILCTKRSLTRELNAITFHVLFMTRNLCIILYVEIGLSTRHYVRMKASRAPNLIV